MKLRIGHLSTLYHTSILLMAQETLKKEAGIDSEWMLFGTGPAIVAAFKNEKIDLAYIGLPPAIIGIDQGVKIKCIAGGHIEGTVLCGKSYKGFPEIERLEDILKQFSGSKIGVPGKGSIHDVIITECLDRFNLRNSVGVVNFRWADEVLEALVRGDVSAAAGTPALAIAVQRYAQAKILYPPSKIWPNNPSYGIVVKDNLIDSEIEILKKFLRLHEDATFFIRTKPYEASKVISDFVGIVDQAFVMDTLKVSPKYCAKLTDGYIASTMDFVRTLKRLGYIKRNIAKEDIFDTSLIDKIHPEKDHYEEIII